MDALRTESYQEIRRYSETYCRENMRCLTEYRWTKDALSHWSRIYEYPYCLESLKDNLKREAKVLDAGSGVTFFPFFLGSFFRVTCVDEEDYGEVYNVINANQGVYVRFVQSRLQELSVESGSHDAVYCISVLEHTSGFAAILKEFRRVLRPGGVLVVTFDISLDGNREGLDPICAEGLIDDIADAFELEYTAANFRTELSDPDAYTTDYVRRWNERLLPWPRYTLLRAIKDFLRGRRRLYAHVKMGFCNVTARKA